MMSLVSAFGVRRCRGTGLGRPRPRSQRDQLTADPWLGRLACCSSTGFRLGGGNAIGAYAVRLLGFEGKAELLANDACKEAADRMRLPARGLHDGGDCHPLGSSQETEDLLLLRAGLGFRLKLFLSGSFSGKPFAAAR